MIRRRSLLVGAPSLALLATGALAAPSALTPETILLPRAGKGPRIVICGGGWGGLSAARHLREELPEADIVVLERNPVFWSCPMSNKWLIDVVDTAFLTQDLLHPAAKWGYHLVQCEVTAIERDKKLVRTSKGAVDYDFLILAGGIRNAYDAWFGDDAAAAEYTRTHFPSAYIPNAEHLALKNKLKNFKGGTVVMTLPPPPHRCPPSPYERACLMAWHFKVNNIPAKILILDPKPKIAPIGAGYKAAFDELYPDIITHVPNAKVKEFDPWNKRIMTEAGDFDFDDAVIMPPHQASEMVFYADLIGTTEDGKSTGWADMNPRLFHANADEDVYIVGDSMGAISPHFGHYPKSGHVANYIAKIVAANIGQRVRGQEVVAELPDNLCYMLVNGDPREAISVEFTYSVGSDGLVHQNQIDIDVRTPDLLEEDFVWVDGMFNDFLR
ncbi:FAD-dependent oxidoreductase [Pseudogemmobacter humi]|uniref:Sulfide dehydrogenase [flavocytochrome c] flavoprotein chain n=1 Tax=Pseudogemmobacter humi TaxID=2483812 RepID=A0A3P5XEF8_9RHOB|nr:FAD/NAD(P)-binding oxidoreductase [Pseudogemmobacter humi]VDC29226.1 Sulfide dehydrogenase [flavocytochrome c] flavoprotein chain precursor [Pseudogemmobacter humi]